MHKPRNNQPTDREIEDALLVFWGLVILIGFAGAALLGALSMILRGAG